MIVEAGIAVVGAGAAGLSLVIELERLSARTGRPAPSVVLVDPARRAGADRTWCFWDDGDSDLDPVVTRSWTRAEVVDRGGRARSLDLEPLRYVMVASGDFYALADEALQRLGGTRVDAPALQVIDGRHGAEVVTANARVRARWVFDSRPAQPRRRARTALLQHFRGWWLRFAEPVLDPGRVVLMDFSVPQPPSGLAFGYVLPVTVDHGLVEYTVFSRERLPDDDRYDRALRWYLSHGGFGAGRGPRGGGAFEVEAVEQGAIPMTDAVHSRRAGRCSFRLGTAGGATRGSTGYTFAAVQRQARGVARALLAGREPMPPPVYPRRHRWLDAVMLRALDRGAVDGPALFVRLFDRHPPARVLRFLDGATGLPQDLAVMASTPVRGMARCAVADAGARLRDRLTGAAREV